MGLTQGTIPPEAQFFSSCEPVKLDRLCASKIQWWDRYKIDILIPKVRGKKEGVTGPKKV